MGRSGYRYLLVGFNFWLAILSGGCTAPTISTSDSGDVTAPVIITGPILTPNTNPEVPLAALLELESDEPTRVSLAVGNDTASWRIEFDDLSSVHFLTVLGFRPDKTHTIEVTVRDAAGNGTNHPVPLEFVTGPVPYGFPPIQMKLIRPDLKEKGLTFFDCTPRSWGTGKNPAASFLVAVNVKGEVVWYYHASTSQYSFGDARRLANGNIGFTSLRNTFTEMDMLGNVVRAFHADKNKSPVSGSISIPIDAIHHEVFEMPSGNLLLLGTELRTFDNFPSRYGPAAPTETAQVVGDVIMEIDGDGNTINSWNMLDILDPYRVMDGSLRPYWNRYYGQVVRDWSHGNSIIYDEQDDALIYSSRHQDAVVKFSRQTGELIWILAPHVLWKAPQHQFLLNPTNFTRWNYHQHAPMITPERNILLFDNGNFMFAPSDPVLPEKRTYSRAVEYAIDEKTMEVTQIWDYGSPFSANELIYTNFLGDADLLPETGNVSITFGRILYYANGQPANKQFARIIEVTRTTPSIKVSDLTVGDDDPAVPLQWEVYRSEHFPDIYPFGARTFE